MANDSTRPSAALEGAPIPADEWAALCVRRQAVASADAARGGEAHPPPTLERSSLAGLALSGGGIRSATFCLGLLRALAKNGVLHRFDYLSTVSGGGYAGAAFGRLFDSAHGAAAVEAGLADDSSLLLRWLRANGRYLTPAGARDLMQAWVVQLRGMVATQFEVGVLALLASCVIVAPHVLGYRGATPWPSSFWWLAAPVAAWFALLAGFAYAWSPDRNDAGSRWRDALLAVLAVAAAWWLGVHAGAHDELAWLGCATLLAVPAARLWLAVQRRRGLPAQTRVTATSALRRAVLVLLGLLAIGAFDLLSWYIGGEDSGPLLTGQVAGSTVVSVVLLILAKAALPLLQKGKSPVLKLPLVAIANVLGVILLALLGLFWLSSLQHAVFHGTLLSAPLARWGAVLVACLAWVLWTGRRLDQVNRWSMHSFYRSRLARTYVSVGNSGTAASRFPCSPLQGKSTGDSSRVERVTTLLPGDDVALADYQPHLHGGPIHLINCCVNQTIDDRSGAYNADRKGLCLSLSTLGWEVGTRAFRPAGRDANAARPPGQGTLAEWIAISGAAVGSGMGSLTRTGLAALCFLSGFRLGYWWQRPDAANRRGWLDKWRAVVREMLAQFPGLRAPAWYLSDGGHFDNTAVYPLLKRHLPLIVVADCGADPGYTFDDLENLVRKARIDLGARIEFMEPDLVTLPSALYECFGTPDTIAAACGSQHLLVARIAYRDGSHGTLLVVKPRLPADVPIDVAGYADRVPDFPQQSTAEQFFSEEQWESYCQLGLALGLRIDANLLAHAADLAATGAAAGATSLISDAQKQQASRRQRIGSTIGASLGAGALATILLTGWQAWSSYRTEAQAQSQAVRTATDALRREVDTLQIALATRSTGQSYLGDLHARIYTLLLDTRDLQLPADLQASWSTLYANIAQICAKLPANDPSLPFCLRDQYALYERQNPVSFREQLLTSYAQATPNPSAVQWLRSIPLLVGQLTHARRMTAAPELDRRAAPPPPAAPPPTQSQEEPAAAALAEAAVPGSAPAPGGTTAMVHASQVETTPVAGAPHAAEQAVVPGAAAPPSSNGIAAASLACATPATAAAARITVYTQIYQEDQRSQATALLGGLRALGLDAPGVENVTRAALAQGRTAPTPWRMPVFLYDGTDAHDQACANALAEWLQAQPGFNAANHRAAALPLPLRLRGKSGTIELWLPPNLPLSRP